MLAGGRRRIIRSRRSRKWIGTGTGTGTCGYGSFFFPLNLRQETECLVGRDGGHWKSGENRN